LNFYVLISYISTNFKRKIMRKLDSTLLAIIILSAILYSCNVVSGNKGKPDTSDKVSQQKDGSYLLKLEDAACYSSQLNPEDNTAEWKFIVPSAGRYEVWLASATKDTTQLDYNNPVKVSLLDKRLEKTPECDVIVKNSGEVAYPYFRTDSYMGSLYFPEPGEYNIQIISEKVESEQINSHNNSQTDNTKLMSLILEPMTR
jgi:hypothetical protein